MTQVTTVPVIGKIQNAPVAALNDYSHLPRYIFIFPDKDIVQDIGHYDEGVKKSIFTHLNWLSKQIGRCLVKRRDNLKSLKPSAVSTEQTRVIWVSMLTRPITDNQSWASIWKLHRKFNEVLEDLLEIENFMHIMHIGDMEEERFFDSRGDLTIEGQKQFWRNLDKQLKNFDFHKTELPPVPSRNQKHQHKHQERRRLPSPTLKLPSPSARNSGLRNHRTSDDHLDRGDRHQSRSQVRRSYNRYDYEDRKRAHHY